MFTSWLRGACFDAKVMVLVGFAMLTHRGWCFPQKATSAIRYAVRPAAADGVAKGLALGWVGLATRVVTAVRIGLFPAAPLAVCDCIFSPATAPIVCLLFPRASHYRNRERR